MRGEMEKHGEGRGGGKREKKKGEGREG